MDFMDISKMRITTRQFDRKPVEKEKIDKVLEAGRWAPTAMDAQPQRILVLDNRSSWTKSDSSAHSESGRNIVR